MVKKKDLSIEDKITWENYIKNPFDVYDKEKNISKENLSNRCFKFDLHGFTLDEANTKVRELMIYCVRNKFKELLLITGKGKHSKNDQDIYSSKQFGKLKFSVPEFLKSNEELRKYFISINEAKQKDGGEGAILIKLKNL